MGMPLELNTLIVTHGKEKRISENIFSLVKTGYRLYPLEIPLEVRKDLQSELSGMAKIHKVTWENEETNIFYELFSLYTTN